MCSFSCFTFIELRLLPTFKTDCFLGELTPYPIRKIIETKDFHALQTHPNLTISQFKAAANKCREVIAVYSKDYINLERFAA